LGSSLSSTGTFPVPFTIVAAFVVLACLMSRFQYAGTFISGGLYSLLSVLKTGALIVAIYMYIHTNSPVQIGSGAVALTILIASAAAIVFINLMATLVQSLYLSKDQHFNKWLSKS
jgi:hypothetical protein